MGTRRSMIRAARGLVVAFSLLALPAVAEGEWTASGALGLELRSFFDAPAYPGQLDGEQPSVTFEPELRWRSAERRHHLKIAAFGRWDGEDDERTHGDVREASYRYVGDSFELLAGVHKVFWGVTESRHLVDVINQVDGVEDIDEEDRLGQPMLQLGFDRSWGRLELYALLGFRERTFAGRDGRLRPPLVVDTDAAAFESGAGTDRIDAALRWSHFIGDWDLGVHLFHGTGREPTLAPSPDGTSLVPFYSVITQLGVDVQHTRGAWLWKLEALGREGQGSTHGAAVAGVEYTVYQLGSTAADLGLIAELLWDGRDRTAPPTLFDEDTFLGARLALNDVQDTQFLAGAIVDHEDQSIAAFVEAGRRFGSHLKLELEARIFTGVDPLGELAAVGEDSFVNLRAAWHW